MLHDQIESSPDVKSFGFDVAAGRHVNVGFLKEKVTSPSLSRFLCLSFSVSLCLSLCLSLSISVSFRRSDLAWPWRASEGHGKSQ